MFEDNIQCSLDPKQRGNCEHLLKYDGIAKIFDMRIVEMKKAYSKVEMDLKDEFKNGVGILHGASIFALCDFAYAVASVYEGEVKLNVSSHIAFLNAGKVGPITAECVELNSGHRISNFEVRVSDGNGNMIAKCQITGYSKPGIRLTDE